MNSTVFKSSNLLFWCFDCSYSTISWVACLARGRVDNVSYAYKQTSSTDLMFRIFNALGQISFAFAGHAVTLEIQATIPSTPEKPSKIPMWRGAIGAYFINAICYFPLALVGYWTFGRDVEDNVLMEFEKPAWLIASANLMVFIHVVGSYQVQTQHKQAHAHTTLLCYLINVETLDSRFMLCLFLT